ncbi:MAG: (d)CMP kinase [Bacteroidetes bacterium]|nr:(d)CMP kinase [Bacteroidota bacterium]
MQICSRLRPRFPNSGVNLHLRGPDLNANKINIAIDGYSSCGKGTLAKALARELGYKFIDSGAMYRAVTLYILNHNIHPEDEAAVASCLPHIRIDFAVNSSTGRNDVLLNGRDIEQEIRTLRVAGAVSQVARITAVRRFLVQAQQAMGREKGVVMDGRDIGTVVFPDAELKIFMTASSEVRAQRRYEELKASGADAEYEEVLANLQERDRIDSTRKDSPLTMTSDYHVLDNSHLSREEQFEMAMEWVREASLGG